MGLSNDLISQFAKITNDQKVSRIDEVTLYGEVVKCEDTIYVKFDGSQELTPVTTVTERDEEGNITNFKYGAASVKTGDRVSVLLKNHSATITGNLSDPPMGRAEVKINDDSIVAKVGEDVKVQIDALGVQINGLTTFTNTTATKLDNLTDGLSRGETVIDGGCIKTGLIDTERINLKGSISYQYSVDGVNDWHEDQTSADVYRRETFDGGKTWGEPYQFIGKNGQNGADGSDADVPDYIQGTYIDGDMVSSFYIKGNKIEAVIPKADGSNSDVGFILTSAFNNGSHRYLQIYSYDSGGAPITVFKGNSMGWWDFPDTHFGKTVRFDAEVDFTNATVTGLSTTATFA